ncbi:unnamed protein product [Nezara viridula]|uniref:TELO2-interacting protein 2 n=1 Tax=Nezara viridula TaxID=85310 RepID=A0A9P0MTE3_NEZVI|nr:unnamed protein product [Nezara viridula]
MDNGEGICDNDKEVVFLTIKKGIEELYVPKFESGFERPADLSDYESYISSCDKRFEELYSSCPNLVACPVVGNKLKQKCIASAIILCGEHSSSSLWTTDVSLELAKLILERLMKECGYTNIADALTSSNGIVFGYILNDLRPKLLKDSWKCFGAAVVCYSWVLKLVESPHLAEHLNNILPTALILVDDFVSENRTLGLKSLEHIINNVGRTQLCWFAQDEVVLKALEPLVFFKDENLIEPLILVLMSLLKKKFPQIINSELQVNEFDPLINTILHNMMLEQRLKIRSAYVKMLPVIIRARGLGMLLHSIALLKVIDEYVLEPTSSVEGLEALKCFIEVCWPRIYAHFDHIFLLICKIYLGIEHNRYTDFCVDKILKEVIQTLQKLCPKKIEERRNELLKNQCFPGLQSLIE